MIRIEHEKNTGSERLSSKDAHGKIRVPDPAGLCPPASRCRDRPTCRRPPSAEPSSDRRYSNAIQLEAYDLV